MITIQKKTCSNILKISITYHDNVVIKDNRWRWCASSVPRALAVSINVWRLAGDTLNVTSDFLYCNHQVHRYFLITLYFKYRLIYTLYTKLQAIHHREHSATLNVLSLFSVCRTTHISKPCGYKRTY
jgi:hypothetical protein